MAQLKNLSSIKKSALLGPTNIQSVHVIYLFTMSLYLRK